LEDLYDAERKLVEDDERKRREERRQHEVDEVDPKGAPARASAGLGVDEESPLKAGSVGKSGEALPKRIPNPLPGGFEGH
jgi:hypothetical protein